MAFGSSDYNKLEIKPFCPHIGNLNKKILTFVYHFQTLKLTENHYP